MYSRECVLEMEVKEDACLFFKFGYKYCRLLSKSLSMIDLCTAGRNSTEQCATAVRFSLSLKITALLGNHVHINMSRRSERDF